MASKADIRQRVAEDLAIVPIGQAVESHDQARIDATYTEIYERIKKRGLATWASNATIPDRAVPYVALMMEEKLLTSYSVPDSRYQRIKADAGPDGNMAMQNLSEMVIPEYESTDEITDF